MKSLFKISCFAFVLSLFIINQSCSQQNKMTQNKLTEEEARVILNKGTERPFTGEYWNTFKDGVYLCRNCENPLYMSDDKFESHCGWPSFDDEIKNAVKRTTDADGIRTEITCSNCGGHLGHVFVGERFTEKNTRHCVNSISLKFEPFSDTSRYQKAIFASGCFWGTQYVFQEKDGVYATYVGYTGGSTENPTYKQVCADTTGHAEALAVVFDSKKTSFRDLAILFFETHDPTQIDRQGPDIGSQYRSEVFYLNENQKAITEELIKILESKGLKIATKVSKAGKFYKAENYHQDYYQKNGGSPYCHFYNKRF